MPHVPIAMGDTVHYKRDVLQMLCKTKRSQAHHPDAETKLPARANALAGTHHCHSPKSTARIIRRSERPNSIRSGDRAQEGANHNIRYGSSRVATVRAEKCKLRCITWHVLKRHSVPTQLREFWENEIANLRSRSEG